MDNKLIYIPNDDTQNLPFYNQLLRRLGIQPNEGANQN